MSTLATVEPQTSHVLDLDDVRIDPAWALRIPAEVALRRHVLPLCKLGDAVIVASTDPLDPRQSAS